MRAHAKVLTLGIALMTALIGSGARADHGPDASGWMEQAGNGHGGNDPAIAAFNVGTVLHDANRFPLNGIQRPDFPRWLAWGTIAATDLDGLPGYQLAMSRGGDDALGWARPAPAFIRDQDGNDVPFILSKHGGFDIVNQSLITYPFIIVYRAPAGGPFSKGQTLPALNTVNAVHVAVSEDGIHWVADRPIEETLSSSVIDGAAATTFKRGIDAPSDLIVNPSGSASCTSGAPAANFPWNCRFVLVYTALGVADARTVAVAGSGGIASDGQMIFSGIAGPVLSTGGTSWDTAAVGHAHIRKISETSYEMTYSGATGTPTCANSTMYCYDLGQATSVNGLAFAKVNVSRPMTPRSLPDQFGALQPSTLVNAQVVGPAVAGHVRSFYGRIAPDADTFQGFTSPVIGTAPRLRIGMPDNGIRTQANTPIELYLGDDLGTNVGLDMTTLDLRIDGIPVGDLGGSFAALPTIVGTYFVPGFRVSSTGTPIRLPDGPHSFSATVRDLDGEPGQISTRFVVDTTPPDSTVTSSPTSPAIGFIQSAGRFTATTSDVGSSIQRVRVTATNPLGLRKIFDSLADRGFAVTQTNAQSWQWSWFVPTLDPHFAIPGEYTFSLYGLDAGGATEPPDATNTVRLLVI